MADFHKVNIADIYKETKDTVVVEFEIPKKLQQNFSFKPTRPHQTHPNARLRGGMGLARCGPCGFGRWGACISSTRATAASCVRGASYGCFMGLVSV